MEQLLRDCRITPIYEGTNGIQAMDLLGRKLGQNKGRPIMDLLGEIQAALAAAKAVARTAPLAEKVEKAVNRLGEVAMHLGAAAMSDKVLTAFAHAHPFLEVCGDVVMAWMLLWRARIAAEGLAAGPKGKDALFYEGQIKSAEFFVHTLLPVTLRQDERHPGCRQRRRRDPRGCLRGQVGPDVSDAVESTPSPDGVRRSRGRRNVFPGLLSGSRIAHLRQERQWGLMQRSRLF